MKKIILLFTGVLFAVTFAFAGDSLRIMESMVMHSRILDQDVKFSVCLPVNYHETKKSFPVVYLLHGLGDDETSWLEYGQISQYADQATRAQEIIPMIFVMPQGYRTYYVNDYKGSFLYQDMFVKELVPYIDSLFRTIPDNKHRAVMGYSMGGFGALNLYLKHPEIFGSAVPLSMSVRTDEQYMSEDAKGWDDQWGSLFGGRGSAGADRLTDYYKENSPFYLLTKMPENYSRNLHIFMDNGDEEQTLCRSNEELHILMHKRNIPHEFRVREGGHNFGYWCSALPNALRFISDSFSSKPYRGDIPVNPTMLPVTANQEQSVVLGEVKIPVVVPPGYETTSRGYPISYFTGKFSDSQVRVIASILNHEIVENNVCPMLLAFLPEADTTFLKSAITILEEKFRIRKGYRFRAISGFEGGAQNAFLLATCGEQFSSCILADAFISRNQVADRFSQMNPDALKRTALFIDTPDKGQYCDGNGTLHMLLRDRDISHEYRVREGSGGFGWRLTELPEILQYTAKKFHK